LRFIIKKGKNRSLKGGKMNLKARKKGLEDTKTSIINCLRKESKIKLSPKQEKRLVEGIIKAKAKFEKSISLLEKRPPGPITGDLFWFEIDGRLSFWAVIIKHPEDPELLYTVPADNFPLIGSRDILVPTEAYWGPLSVRVGYGIWLKKEFLKREGHRFGFLEEEFLKAVHSKIAELVGGEIKATKEQMEIDNDPSYILWMIETEQLVNTVEEKAKSFIPESQKKPKVIYFDVRSKIEPELFPKGNISYLDSISLAASTQDLQSDIKKIKSSMKIGAEKYRVKLKYPGKLYIVNHKGKIKLQYFPTKKSFPPKLFIFEGKKPVEVLWKRSQIDNSYISRKSLKWQKNEIKVQIEDCPIIIKKKNNSN